MQGIRRFMAVLLAMFASVLAMGSAGAAEEFHAYGSNAAGRPGDRVFLNLEFNYGLGFQLVTEELIIDFPTPSITFSPGGSKVLVGGQEITLPEYRQFLQMRGSVQENENYPGTGVGRKGYYLGFTTLLPIPRQGVMHLRAAFDIHSTALPGYYRISVSGMQQDELAMLAESECCELPSSLQSLGVAVLAVPEPGLALLLLPGLALVVLRARRVSART
jgi:hypothetical protein